VNDVLTSIFFFFFSFWFVHQF